MAGGGTFECTIFLTAPQNRTPESGIAFFFVPEIKQFHRFYSF